MPFCGLFGSRRRRASQDLPGGIKAYMGPAKASVYAKIIELPFIFNAPESNVFTINVSRGSEYCTIEAFLNNDPKQKIKLSAQFESRNFESIIKSGSLFYEVKDSSMCEETLNTFVNLIKQSHKQESKPQLSRWGW